MQRDIGIWLSEDPVLPRLVNNKCRENCNLYNWQERNRRFAKNSTKFLFQALSLVFLEGFKKVPGIQKGVESTQIDGIAQQTLFQEILEFG
jgi:hypothetical protein